MSQDPRSVPSPFALARFSQTSHGSQAQSSNLFHLSEPSEVLSGTVCEFPEALRKMEQGGEWFGFLGYELGEITESIAPRPDCDWGIPDFWFARFEKTTPTVARVSETPPHSGGKSECSLSSEEYRDRLGAIRRYLEAGDVYQVNLSVRFDVETEWDPQLLFHHLSQDSNAAYSCYLDAGDWKVLSLSPELFLHLEQGSIRTRPIKGTIGKTGDPVKDRAALDWLVGSPKNLAELLMIVDLERNDLGRLCNYGSVAVDRFPEVLELPHLYHLLATVRGDLRTGVSLADIVSATFPGGSISGAPKRRALEIIRELEPHRRGPYCGAMGYLSRDRIHLNLAIRTAVWKDRRLRFWGGGGIVIDHDPDMERREILVKLRPFFDSLGLASNDLW